MAAERARLLLVSEGKGMEDGQPPQVRKHTEHTSSLHLALSVSRQRVGN